jgi:shikimate kinase
MLLLSLSRDRERAFETMILKLKRTPGIFLVGFMGSGKSTVGRALADELGWSFVDLDEEIERRENASIGELFEVQGEDGFREIEAALVRERVRNVQNGRPQVISLGDGAILSEENFDLISNNGVIVWLDCEFSHVERRIGGETRRPLLRDPEKLRELFESRRDSYARAEYRIHIADDDSRSVVSRILALGLF